MLKQMLLEAVITTKLMETAHPEYVNNPLVTTMSMKTLVTGTTDGNQAQTLDVLISKNMEEMLPLVSLPPYVLR